MLYRNMLKQAEQLRNVHLIEQVVLLKDSDARHIIEAAKTIEGLSSREVQVQSLNRVLL